MKAHNKFVAKNKQRFRWDRKHCCLLHSYKYDFKKITELRSHLFFFHRMESDEKLLSKGHNPRFVRDTPEYVQIGFNKY